MKKFLLKSLFLLCALVVGSNAWATDSTVDFTSLGTQTWTSYSLTSGAITIATDLNNGSAPTINNAQYRWKTNNIITISTSTGTLKSIQFKTNSTEAYGPKNLSYNNSAITSSGTSYTWTAPSGISSASFTVTSEARLTEIHVTYTVTPTHALTYSATNGSISGVVYGTSTAVASGASVAEGGKVTLTATPASGYAFSNWSVEGTGAALSDTGINPTTFTMGTANATVTANFVVSSTPSIGLSSTSVVATSAETEGTITVTYNNIASVDAEVLFYESDGTTLATYDWIDAEINATDNTKLDYAIGENTGAARTAYMKVHQKNSDVYSVLITVTQEAIVIDAPTISPAAGAVAAGTTVTLTQASADQIRYTTDGTAPTKTTGTVYSTPIVVTDAITIKAIAIKNGVASDIAEAAYTITVATPECNLASNTSYLEGTYLVLTSAGNTIYYNMTIDGDTPDDPNSSSTEYTGPIALGSGNIRIKAIAYDAYNHSSSILTRTFAGVAPTALPFNWAGGGKSNLTSKKGVTSKGLGTDYASSTYGIYQVKFDNDGDFIQIFTSGQPGIVKIGAKTNGGTNNSSIKIQESPNGADFTDVQTFEITGDQYDINNFETTVAFATTTRVVRILFVKPNSGANVGVGPISIAIPEPSTPVDNGDNTITLTTTANMAGWRTFAPVKADQNYTANADVYYVSAAGSSSVTLVKIDDGVPANTPVILHQTSGTTITLTETGTNITAPGASNLLAVSTADQNLGKVYRLGYKSAYGVGFYTYTTTSAPEGIVYINPSSPGHEFLGLDFDGETTGVNEITNTNLTNNTNEFYNLAGQRVAQPTKGLYIVNGRKVIIK